MDTRELLPPEIWELVFDKVEDPQDWLNLYRSSSYFLEIIGEEKLVTALFPLVIPHVSEYLGVLLSLRLVSRPWKEAMDKMLENNAESDSAYYIRRHPLGKFYNFSNPRRISSFLKWFETHSGNPFVGRCALLLHDSKQGSQGSSEYSLLATRLLDKFGTQLKGLQVKVFHTSLINCATRMLDCVQRSPNLESLQVHCHIFYRHGGGGGESGLRSPIIDQEGLIPPLLPKLKSITFSSGCAHRRDMLDLQNAVVRLCCNPNSLKHAKTVGLPSALHTFPNLESADAILKDTEDYADLPSPPWPLSELVMKDCFQFDRIAPLFKCIEHFKATLTSLHLQCPLRGDDPLELTLDLPRLRQLIIQSERDYYLSLGYLTRLNNLEALSIEEDPRDFNRTGARVQCQVTLLRLWEVLPKLKEICLVNSKWGRRHDDMEDIMMATRSNREFQRKQPTQRPFQLWTHNDGIPLRQRVTDSNSDREDELLYLLLPHLE